MKVGAAGPQRNADAVAAVVQPGIGAKARRRFAFSLSLSFTLSLTLSFTLSLTLAFALALALALTLAFVLALTFALSRTLALTLAFCRRRRARRRASDDDERGQERDGDRLLHVFPRGEPGIVPDAGRASQQSPEAGRAPQALSHKRAPSPDRAPPCAASG